MTDSSLISLSNIHLSYAQQIVLSDINFEISRNDIITIIGPNGAGKSSLVKIIAGLITPNKGDIVQQGDVTISYVPQKLFMDKSMPLKVSRFLSLAQASKDAYRNALDKVGANHLWSKQMHALSGGELQRVLLARAIARHPDLLLLDEPLQGVDINGQTELYRLIADIRDELGCAVVMVSHDLHLVMAQTDHVLCLNHHVCCQGKPENVSKHPEYINLFGQRATPEIAVYTHHHDHHHNLHGEVEDCNEQCNHD